MNSPALTFHLFPHHQGNTALDKLRSWYTASVDVLSAADILECQRRESALLRKMGKIGKIFFGLR